MLYELNLCCKTGKRGSNNESRFSVKTFISKNYKNDNIKTINEYNRLESFAILLKRRDIIIGYKYMEIREHITRHRMDNFLNELSRAINAEKEDIVPTLTTACGDLKEKVFPLLFVPYLIYWLVSKLTKSEDDLKERYMSSLKAMENQLVKKYKDSVEEDIISKMCEDFGMIVLQARTIFSSR
jgi:hypothetical protein